MRIGYLAVFATLFLLFSVQVVYAVDVDWDIGWKYVGGFLKWVFGLPDEWLKTFPNFMYYFLLPFLLIWFVVLGFLRELRIFRRAPTWIEWFISFAMAGITLGPTRWLVSLVVFLASAGTVWAVGAFFIMFGLGVWIHAHVWGRAMLGRGSAMKDLSNLEKDINDQMAGLIDDLKNKKIAVDEYERKMKQLRKTLDDIQLRKRTLLEE